MESKPLGEFPVIVRHSKCGGIAAYCRRVLMEGELVMAKDFARVDGSSFQVGNLLVCAACDNMVAFNQGEARFEAPR